MLLVIDKRENRIGRVYSEGENENSREEEEETEKEKQEKGGDRE